MEVDVVLVEIGVLMGIFEVMCWLLWGKVLFLLKVDEFCVEGCFLVWGDWELVEFCNFFFIFDDSGGDNMLFFGGLYEVFIDCNVEKE